MKLNASLRSVPVAITTLACALLLVSCGGGGGYGGDTTPPVTLAPQVTLTLSNGAGVSGAVVVTLEATKWSGFTLQYLENYALNDPTARLPSEFSNAFAAPWNAPLTVSGSVLSATACTRVSTSPSEAPGASPKEIVTAGS